MAKAKTSRTATSASTLGETYKAALAILVLMQCAPLILYTIHVFPSLSADHVTLFAAGLAFLSATAYLYYHVLYRVLNFNSALGFIFTGIAFTAYIDSFIATSLLSPKQVLGRFYLDKGEKYFNSTYGFMCLFWDGTFHVAIQFAIAVWALTKQNYHFTALIWAGSVINSMAPLLLGAATGPYSDHIQLATALNAPYIFLPVSVCIYLLTRTPPIHRKHGAGTRVKSHHLLADIVLMVYNFIIPIVHILRTMCVMGSQAKIVSWWLKIEPVFNKSAALETNDQQDYAFMAIQAVQWCMWFVPWHWAALFEQIERIRTGKRSVLLGTIGVDLSALMLGAYLQSMACHFVASYFDITEGQIGLHLRATPLSQEFWLINVSTLACALLHFVHFHVQDIEDEKKD